MSRTVSIAAVSAAAMLFAAPAYSADCPMLTPTLTPITLELPQPKDQPPKVGDRINVTIPPSTSGGAITDVSACVDAVNASMTSMKDKNATTSAAARYAIAVPSIGNTAAGPLSSGDHTLTVYWNYEASDKTKTTASAKDAITVFKPTLISVHVVTISKANKTYRVELTGDGFDVTTKDNNKIVMDDVLRDVCWSGSTNCTPSPNGIRGNVPGPRTIVLENVDPSEELTARFKVCHREQSDERCSSPQTDATSEKHMLVVASSIGVLAAIAALVVLLVLVGRDFMTIWGERYVMSVLLLDKETDTYSLSKLQFYIWTAVAVFGYAYLTLSRFWVQHWFELPPIPSGLPGIIGISAGAAVGALVVTQINGPKGAGRLHPGLSDLITTGDVVAAERVQFLVWTLIGAAGFFFAVANLDPRTIVDLPDVPQSLLTISGISAFGYLGGKLARDPGPVINEVIIQTGPDPDAVPPGSAPAAPAPSATSPAWLQSIQTAVATITDAQRKLGAVTGSPALGTVLRPVNAAFAAAQGAVTDTAKLTASSPAGDLSAARTAIDKRVPDTDKGVNDAVKAKDALSQAGVAADLAAAVNAIVLAQSASKAVQDIQGALKAAAPAAPPAAASSTQFGVIDLRGRMLSQDATFKLSIAADSDASDFQLVFDRLEPSPKDDKHMQKPRVVDRDTDSRDNTLAKRLRLVVRLDDKTRQFFVAKSTHTLTVTNPDQQKVAYKFDVPDTQKTS